uniref:Uncharacterized protein n=1 Tax=Plectus sambesii TaxID=2011161 RepID=A0A914V503_9BILA
MPQAPVQQREHDDGDGTRTGGPGWVSIGRPTISLIGERSTRATNSLQRYAVASVDCRQLASTSGSERAVGRAGQRSAFPTGERRVLARKGGEHRLTDRQPTAHKQLANCPLTTPPLASSHQRYSAIYWPPLTACRASSTGRRHRPAYPLAYVSSETLLARTIRPPITAPSAEIAKLARCDAKAFVVSGESDRMFVVD